MIGMGRWAITVSEVKPGEFHFTVLEAVADDGKNFVFRPAIQCDAGHESAISAWVAGLSELTNYGWDAINLLMSEGDQEAEDEAEISARERLDALAVLHVTDRAIGARLPKH